MKPAWYTKFFFWLIVGCLSTFFAEIPAGSDFFPFFHTNGLVLTLPIYTLHSIILACIIFRFNRQNTFPSFYVAGILFGMYEAYLTKVLWNPPWGDAFVSIGNIAVVETIVLVLFWHPILAFIIPIFIAETSLTCTRVSFYALPVRIQNLFQEKKKTRIFLLSACVLFGLYQSTNAPTPLHSLISCPVNTLCLMIIVFLWKRTTKGVQYSLQSLLPGKLSFFVLILLLIFMYIFLGFNIRFDALPPISGQLSIIGLYLVLFVLLYICLKHPAHPSTVEDLSLVFSSSRWFVFSLSLLFALFSFIGNYFLSDLRAVILLTGWFIFFLTGSFLFIVTIKLCITTKS